MAELVIVYTSKGLKTFEKEGGVGYWKGSAKRMGKCAYVVATKSNTLRESFPEDGNKSIGLGDAFMICKVAGVVKKGERNLIEISEYTEIEIKKLWPGNKNPIAYEKVDEFENEHGLTLDTLDWKHFTAEEPDPYADVPALSINEAKAALAKKLGIDASNIEISIKA